MDTTTFSLRTGRAFSCTDLTDRIDGWLAGRGDGLCNVFAPHATAGIALMETGSGTEADLETVVDRLLPRDDGVWVHRHGSPGHGADHVLPALVSSSMTVPVLGGRLALGTWQSVVLVDPNRDNAERTVRLSFLGG
ncbi:MAG TPA: secondary thiamine-phosphate synthase enzyme YjbQ [Egibacteraceae bacterium]|jgi:secondary thiamine-phosphate synthase enzyme|nr:secondary thiamine-phosphate synthase enzyme YjbQ [Egibacteraceae bacterium]